jgi:O-antigen/teichoic acid export membrane protein
MSPVRKLLMFMFVGLLTGAGARVIQLVMHLVLARELGLIAYGAFAYAFGLARLVSHLAPLGWQTALTRFVGEYHEKEEWGLYRGAVRASFEVGLGMVVVAELIMLAVLWLAPLSPEFHTSLLYGAVLLPILTLSLLLRRQLVGLNAAKTALFLDDALPPLLTTAFVLLVGGSVETVLIAFSVATVLAVTIAAVRVWQITPAAVFAAKARFERRAWWRIALPNVLGTISQRGMSQVDVLIIGPFLGLAAVSLYSVAYRLNHTLSFLPMIVGVLLSSRMTRSYYRGEVRRTAKLFVFALVISLSLSLPVGAIMLLFPETLLELTFGPEFVAAALLLQIITLGQIANAAAGPTGTVMTLTGKQNAFGWIMLSTSIFNIVANLVAVLTVGLIGVAVVTALTLLVRNIAQLWVVTLHLKLLELALSVPRLAPFLTRLGLGGRADGGDSRPQA